MKLVQIKEKAEEKKRQVLLLKKVRLELHALESKYSRLNSLAKKELKDVYGEFPANRGIQYDMVEVIKCLVDDSEFDQYKELYGKSIVCGYGRIDGWSVGIVANQRKVVKTKKGEMLLTWLLL